MLDAAAGLERLYACIAQVEALAKGRQRQGEGNIPPKDIEAIDAIEGRFQQAMDNDFNTAQAQGVLFDLAKIINRLCKSLPAAPAATDIDALDRATRTMKRLAAIMGILNDDAAAFLKARKEKLLAGLEIDEERIIALIKDRYSCRAEKNWARGDEIRDELLAKGIELKDGPDGTTWSVKRS